jgi:hypothetical protein
MFQCTISHSQLYQSTHKLYKMWLHMAKELSHAHIKRENTCIYFVIA